MQKNIIYGGLAIILCVFYSLPCQSSPLLSKPSLLPETSLSKANLDPASGHSIASPSPVIVENFGLSYVVVELRLPSKPSEPTTPPESYRDCLPPPSDLVKSSTPESVKRLNVVSVHKNGTLQSFVSDFDLPLVLGVTMVSPGVSSGAEFKTEEDLLSSFNLKSLSIYEWDVSSKSLRSKELKYQDRWDGILKIVSNSIKVWMISINKDKSMSIIARDKLNRPTMVSDSASKKNMCIFYDSNKSEALPSFIQINFSDPSGFTSTNLMFYRRDPDVKDYSWLSDEIVKDLVKASVLDF